MTKPVLFRKRLIPDECIRLKDDEILHFSPDDQILVTKWHALKPKKDLHHGYSAYFWKEGFKVSKFYREDGSLIYWYCDIIDVNYPCEINNCISDESSQIIHEVMSGHTTEATADTSACFLATDLLADVIIYPDGFVKVVDLDELNTALDNGALTLDMLKKAISGLSRLLDLIYSGKFKTYQEYLEKFEV